MKYLYSLSALAATTFAAVHEVTVGPGLVYSPDTISNAASGDIISFMFTGDHNVVSGSFDSPCQPSGGIYSGAMPAAGDVFSVTLNSTDPLWLYCSVPGHCEGGMAMVVNPPSDQTLDAYKSAASGVSSSTSPDAVSGGVFGAVSNSTSPSGSASSSMSATASRTSAASSSASASATGNGAAVTGIPMAAGMFVAGLAALL